MNKKISVGLLVVVLILIGVVFSNKKNADDRVLAILPLTGANAQHGEWAKRGIQMAIGNKSIEVIYEDSQLDPKKAISIINQYKNDSSIKAIFALGSPVAMAIAPSVNENKIPTFSIVSAPAYSTPDDYTFRINGTTDIEMGTVKDELYAQNKKKIAIVYLNNDYGKGLLTTFKKVIDPSYIVSEEGFLQTDTDLRSQILKIKNTNPDSIFIASWGKEAGIFIKQARELGLDTQIFCGSACYSPELIDIAGEFANGVVIISPSTKTSESFAKNYFEIYKEAPNYVTTRNYDAMNLLLDAFGKCSEEDNRSCIKDYIASVKDYKGLVYPINFDTNGDLIDQYQISFVDKGQIVTK